MSTDISAAIQYYLFPLGSGSGDRERWNDELAVIRFSAWQRDYRCWELLGWPSDLKGPPSEIADELDELIQTGRFGHSWSWLMTREVVNTTQIDVPLHQDLHICASIMGALEEQTRNPMLVVGFDG